MKTFRFLAFQDLKSYYKGYLEIEADSEEDAKAKLRDMSKEELEENCFDWTQSTDYAEAEGDIDVDSLSIHEIY